MGARSTKLSKGVSSLNIGGPGALHDKYLSTLSLNKAPSASEWSLVVVRDSFTPEAVGLPGSRPQTKFIGDKPSFLNFETIRRPKAITQRLTDLTNSLKNSPTKGSNKSSSPKKQINSDKPRPVETEIKSITQINESKKTVEKSVESPDLVVASKQSFNYNYVVVNNKSSNSNHTKEETILTNGSADSAQQKDLHAKITKTSLNSDSETDTESSLRGTKKSLTGSERATLDYLDQVLIEDALEIFDDTNQTMSPQEKDKAIVNYSNHGVSEESVPVHPPNYDIVISNPDYDISDNESQDHETPVKNPQVQASDVRDETITVTNSYIVANHKPVEELNVTDKTEYNKLELSKPGKVQIPLPDYNDAPPSLVSGRYVNSVIPTVEENSAKSSEQSFDSPTTFILPAAETYQPKLAKQIAYVKPNIKEPARKQQPSMPKRDYEDVTIIEKTGPTGNPRVVSMISDTPSYVESRKMVFDERDSSMNLPVIARDDMMSPSVRNMVKRFEVPSPAENAVNADKIPGSPRKAYQNGTVNQPRQPSWVH